MKIRACAAAVAATAALSSLAGAPAQAADVGEFQCRARINLQAGSGVTTCSGTAFGVGTSGSTPSSYIQASVAYNELACPATGSASGSVSLSENAGGPFTVYASVSYQRVGAVAVVVLTGAHTGAGVAVFIPDQEDISATMCSDPDVGITLVGAFAAI